MTTDTQADTLVTERQVISLNGLWDFVADLDPNYHQRRNYASPHWDRRRWLKVTVPGVWNKYAERYDVFEGVCWLAREVTLPELWPGSVCLLRFGGVNYQCEVYINGQLAGTHEGGYTEFVLDVSPYVRSGTNSLAVRVDNRSLKMKLPPVLGYFNYGGIHRDVTLELYPGAYLADLACDAQPVDGGGCCHVSGLVANAKADTCAITVSCGGSTVRTAVEPGGRVACDLFVPNVATWSPASPALYPVRVELYQGTARCDMREFTTGFRTIAARGTHIELNGEPIDLRGICYLYDSPSYGLQVRPEQYEIDIALLRELKVNAIRSHFPFPHDFLDACDRAGIMVWLEIPVYCIDPAQESCRAAFTDTAWRDLALSMLDEMVQQAKLHPSVCIYGIGNECQLEATGAMAFFQALAERARALDPTRLISYACLYGLAGTIADMVDVVGFNQYWGWYDVLFQKTDVPQPDTTMIPVSSSDSWRADEHSAAPITPRTVDLHELERLLNEQASTFAKPILLTEFGADSLPGYRSSAAELWSEEYHAEVLRATLAIVDGRKGVCGTFPFVFADYRDPSKEINGYWDEMNYKGVVTYERRKKLPFFALRDGYIRREARVGDVEHGPARRL